MASKSRTFSLLLPFLFLLLSFSQCFAHHCKCMCNMGGGSSYSGGFGSSNIGSGSGSSITGSGSGSGSGSSITGSSSGSGSGSGGSFDSGFSSSTKSSTSGSITSESGSSYSGSSNTGSSGSVSSNSGTSDVDTSTNVQQGGSFTSTEQTTNSPPSNSLTGQSSSSGSIQTPFNFGSKANISNIIAFGDSFTDTGNAGLLGGLKAFAGAVSPGSPYGSSFSPQPSTRFSNGRVLVDFLSEVLHLPYLSPFQNKSADFSKGVNFAVGGSSVFPPKFFEDNNVGRTVMWKLVPDCLKMQLDWFQQFLNNIHCNPLNIIECKLKLAKSLFWVGEMGFNDYTRNFGANHDIHSIMEKLIEFKINLVKMLLDKGAKFMIVQGLPPIGCFPLQMSTSSPGDRDEHGCVRSVNSMIKTHNDLLGKKLDLIKKQFPDCSIAYADFWNAFLTIMKNPMQFGFREPFKACCGAGTGPFNFNPKLLCGLPGSSKCQDPAKFMSWDGVHPTEAMFGKVADMLFNQNFCNPPFKQLLSAVPH